MKGSEKELLKEVQEKELYLTRYIESHKDTLPKEKVIEYYQRMIELCEEAGCTSRVVYLREQLKNVSENASTTATHQSPLFCELLMMYKQDVYKNPELARQYAEELPLFTDAVKEQNEKPNYSASRKIVNAAMTISRYRVREKRKHGWLCGTYMSRVTERFTRKVKFAFTEEELTELIESLVKGDVLSQEQEDRVYVLLHNTPRTAVNPFVSYLFDEKKGEEPSCTN